MPNVKVMLIDDDPSYHVLTSRMLARADQEFDVDWVGSYQEGLEAIRQQKHDVYLVDYHLGRVTGLDLLREAEVDSLPKPVIMMTGHGKHNLDLEAIQSGAADYIDKVELRPASLQRSIRYALERARIIEHQRESEQMYRSLIEEAFDGILITDSHGEIILTNDQICHMTGWDNDTLTAMGLREIVKPIQPEDDVLAVGKGLVAERLLQHATAQPLDVEVSAKPISDNRIQFIVRDISGRKATLREREEYIQKLQVLHQVDDEMSQELNLEFVSAMSLDAAIRLSGGETGFIAMREDDDLRVMESIGPYSTLDPAEYLPRMTLVQKVMADETPRRIMNVANAKDYVAIHERTEAQIILPLLSYDELVGIMVLETPYLERFTDDVFDFLNLITSRVAVAAQNARLYKVAQDRYHELQEIYSQVADLESIKTDMIRIAAHDIRNPVSVILGYTELMQTKKFSLTDRVSNYIKNIERAARNVERITKDILSLERVENMSADNLDPVDLTAIIAEVFDESRAKAELKNQTFTLESISEPLPVVGDEAQLREAAVNFISNAIKYTDDEGTIRVTLDADETVARYRVIDNGYGIPQEQQNSLFKPFFRAKSPETRDVEGTGLGLYLIKNIINRYNGQIVFESTYGEGSVFGFDLPIARD
jgi:PAS domain S-box-containing protein